MEEKMQDVGSGNPGGSSESESTSTNIVRVNTLWHMRSPDCESQEERRRTRILEELESFPKVNMREVAENYMDSGAANGKMTSIDSGIETGNDSNDSAVVPIETRQLSVVSDDMRRQKSLDTFKRWSLEMQEICKPFCSMSSDAIEAACSGAKTFPYGSPSLSSSTCGPLVVFDKYRLRRASVEKQLALACRSRNKWSPCKIDFPDSRRRGALSEGNCRLMRVVKYGKEAEERRLRVAAAINNVERVERLLEQGVDPNNCDEQLRTPLHLSSGRGYTEVVRLLLRYGANPSLKDCIGNTPLHLAAVTSKISVVTLLLEAGCDPLSPDLHGYNPLQLAETKLRLLQNCKGDDMLRIKSEVHEVVNMLVAYLKNRDGFGDQVDALSTFCSRLSLSNTSNQVQDEVRDLLCNIDSLSLKS